MGKKIFLGIILIGVLFCTSCHSRNTTVMPEKKFDINEYRMTEDSSFISLMKELEEPDLQLTTCSFCGSSELYILYMNEDYTEAAINSFSLETGKLKRVVDWKLGEESYLGCLNITETSPLTVYDTYGGYAYFYDEENSKMNAVDLDMMRYGYSLFANGGVYSLDSYTGDIIYTDVHTEQNLIYDAFSENEVRITAINAYSEADDLLFVTGTNSARLIAEDYIINPKTGKIVNMMSEHFSYLEDSDNEYAYSQEDGVLQISSLNLDTTQNPETYTFNGASYVDTVNIKNNQLYLVYFDDEAYKILKYDLKSGKGLNQTDLNSEKYGKIWSYCDTAGYGNVSEDGSMMRIMVCSEGVVNDIVLWAPENLDEAHLPDITKKTEDENFIHETTSLIDYGNLTAMSDKIYEKHGVRVYFGKNIPASFPEYKAECNEDMELIKGALETISESLDKYPDNFFRFMMEKGYIYGYNIYLTGTIYADGTGSISNAAGFATISDNFETIVLDVNLQYSMQNNLYHEISHSIYDKINNAEIFANGEIFDEDEWMKLNPPGFKYYESYLDENGEGYDWTGDSSCTSVEYYQDHDLNNVYFIDSYSKTFITEDLARLMEYDMSYGTEIEYMNAVHIKEKLDFYYKAIRDVWDTSDWPQKTTWEE